MTPADLAKADLAHFDSALRKLDAEIAELAKQAKSLETEKIKLIHFIELFHKYDPLSRALK